MSRMKKNINQRANKKIGFPFYDNRWKAQLSELRKGLLILFFFLLENA